MSANHSNPLRMLAHMLSAVFNSRSAFLEQWQQYQILSPGPDSIAGRWVGEWVSQATGHRGDLKCVLSQISTEAYRAHFFATFSKFFRVGYATDLKLDNTAGRICLRGEENLGALAGGVYRCEGEITGNAFNCEYSCKYDRGIFRLKRLD